jgi:hypothetical protein
MRTVSVYSVCIDCVGCLYAEHGHPELSDCQTAVNELVKSYEIVTCTGNEVGYSWYPCEICKRKIAGQRFQVEAVERWTV